MRGWGFQLKFRSNLSQWYRYRESGPVHWWWRNCLCCKPVGSTLLDLKDVECDNLRFIVKSLFMFETYTDACVAQWTQWSSPGKRSISFIISNLCDAKIHNASRSILFQFNLSGNLNIETFYYKNDLYDEKGRSRDSDTGDVRKQPLERGWDPYII